MIPIYKISSLFFPSRSPCNLKYELLRLMCNFHHQELEAELAEMMAEDEVQNMTSTPAEVASVSPNAFNFPSVPVNPLPQGQGAPANSDDAELKNLQAEFGF